MVLKYPQATLSHSPDKILKVFILVKSSTTKSPSPNSPILLAPVPNNFLPDKASAWLIPPLM